MNTCQANKFVLGVFHHLEWPRANHRLIFKLGHGRAFQTAPDVLWHDVKENELALDVGNGIGQGDDDIVAVVGYNRFKKFGVDGQEGEIFLGGVQIV